MQRELSFTQKMLHWEYNETCRGFAQLDRQAAKAELAFRNATAPWLHFKIRRCFYCQWFHVLPGWRARFYFEIHQHIPTATEKVAWAVRQYEARAKLRRIPRAMIRAVAA